jgi:hypothetical protein
VEYFFKTATELYIENTDLPRRGLKDENMGTLESMRTKFALYFFKTRSVRLLHHRHLITAEWVM